uniref:BOS complex subunit NCLN n=1 Tax=Trichuris muris TaxID=70415 RepID=A0A5S6QAY5_TRIMR
MQMVAFPVQHLAWNGILGKRLCTSVYGFYFRELIYWFCRSEMDDIAEFIRSQYAVCVLLLSFVVTSSFALVPSRSTSETETFKVFRLPQFDLHGNEYGTRARRVHAEVTLTLSSSSGVRRCLLVWWKNMPVDFMSKLISSNAAALIIIIPINLQDLTAEERKAFLEMEQALITSSISMPVYVAVDSPLVRKILDLAGLNDAQPKASPFDAIYSIFFGKSYKFVTKVQQLVAPAHYSMESIVGRLSAFDQREHVATVAIVAHYDTLGLAPSRAFGFDSNGTGVILLLELLRIFSRLYHKSNTRAKYNLIFVLSGGGKMNFLGSKHWIEEIADKRGRSGGASSIEFAFCLDSIFGGGSNLHMHVSKAPKESTPVARFQQKLNESAALHGVPLDIVQKKVNLADDRLSWEHEAFNIRRMHAFTLSGFRSPHDPMRHSILDLRYLKAILRSRNQTKYLRIELAIRRCECFPNSVLAYYDSLENHYDACASEELKMETSSVHMFLPARIIPPNMNTDQ